MNSVFDDLEQVGSGAAYIEEICLLMERTDMFRDLDRQDVEQIALYITVYKAAQGVEVMREGDRESYLCVLATGKLQIMKRDEDNTNKKLAVIRAGKSIGEMSVVDGMHHSASAIALEDCQLLLLTKANFDLLMGKNPVVGLILMNKISNLMSLRLRQTSGVLVDYLAE